jgi:hypothetical protein
VEDVDETISGLVLIALLYVALLQPGRSASESVPTDVTPDEEE